MFHITELSVFLLWTWKLLVIWKWWPYVCEGGGEFSFWPSTVVLWVKENKTAEVLWVTEVPGEISKIGTKPCLRKLSLSKQGQKISKETGRLREQIRCVIITELGTDGLWVLAEKQLEVALILWPAVYRPFYHFLGGKNKKSFSLWTLPIRMLDGWKLPVSNGLG